MVHTGTDHIGRPNEQRTLITFAYGIATIFSGFWHIVNIADGTKTGSKKDWRVVFAEVTGGVPRVAKIIKFLRNPQLKSILVAVDTFSYGAATIAYISAASARFNRRREQGVHTFEARPTIDYHTILMMTSNQPSRMLEVGWFPLAWQPQDFWNISKLGAGLPAPDSTGQHHRTIEKVLLFIVLSGVTVTLSGNGPTLDSTIECYKVLYRARIIL
ncbi:hypothetical protein BYT27DRAFT_7244516 [Phlegmacium glaucopus]|nr:hypothetical protein BYT27DRAFT_7244516 [Phlegmacium glaucopus]